MPSPCVGKSPTNFVRKHARECAATTDAFDLLAQSYSHALEFDSWSNAVREKLRAAADHPEARYLAIPGGVVSTKTSTPGDLEPSPPYAPVHAAAQKAAQRTFEQVAAANVANAARTWENYFRSEAKEVETAYLDQLRRELAYAQTMGVYKSTPEQATVWNSFAFLSREYAHTLAGENTAVPNPTGGADIMLADREAEGLGSNIGIAMAPTRSGEKRHADYIVPGDNGLPRAVKRLLTSARDGTSGGKGPVLSLVLPLGSGLASDLPFPGEEWFVEYRFEAAKLRLSIPLGEEKGGSSNNPSGDPNDKLVDVGSGDQRHIMPDTIIPYTIRFENKPDVPAPAQLINIDDPLPDSLDPWTFEFGSMQFEHHLIEVPPGLMYYYTEVDLRPEGNNLIVSVEAEFDPLARVAHWTFTGLDPATGELTEDVFAGFLPPNNENHDGEGFVSFSVSPVSGLASGDRIENVATIVFDWNEPIDTPLIFNTIDIGAPTSLVDDLETESPRDILVSWTGQDDDKGSGVAAYDVFVSVDSGSFEPWLIGTPSTAAIYPGEPDHTYAFYCVATDAVGHRETKDPVAETDTIARDTATISLVDPEPGQLLNPGDIVGIRWSDWDPNRSATIGLFWDTDRSLLNNTPQRDAATWGTIAEGIPGAGGSNRHDWQIPVDVALDWVFVYATITDTVASYTDYWARPIGVGDLDHDGMLDAWELEVIARIPGIGDIHGLKPDGDEDGDGWTNRQEFDGGTDPTDRLERPDWRMDLFLDGAGLPLLTFGYSDQATDGWDESLDSGTSVLSAHFLAPGGEDDLRLETDIRAARDQGVLWDLVLSPQFDDIEIAWNSDAIPPDHGLFLTETTEAGRDPSPAVDMLEQQSVYVRQDAVFRLELDPPRVLDLELQPGWNLVSLPMRPSRERVSRLLNRQYLGPVRTWEHDQRGAGAYAEVETATPKTGMWVNWQGATRSAFTVRGRPIRDAAVMLRAGWNLIGPIGECANPFTHPVWGWDAETQGYVRVPPGDPLLPGKAYWVYSPTDQDVWLADP